MSSQPSSTPPYSSPFRSKIEKAQDRDEKREAVLRAAVRMFNARGFYATSLDDVAASLAISKPTIYYYLGNKEQVLLECVTRGLGQLLAAAGEATQGEGTGLHRLRAFLRRYAQITMDDFGRCVVRTGDEALSVNGASQFRALKRKIDSAMRDLIAQAIADGSMADLDIKLTAFTLAGALNWPARWQDPQGQDSAETVAAAMVDILTAGLARR
jgi:AcrR family transcriptional regulator